MNIADLKYSPLTPLYRLGAVLLICIGALTTPSVSSGMDAVEVSDTRVDLGVRAENFYFLDDQNIVLLMSNRDRFIGVFDINHAEILRVFEFDRLFKNVTLSDVAILPNGPIAYIVGQADTDSYRPRGILVRLNFEFMEAQFIRFTEEFLDPTVAVSEQGQIYIGDLNSATVTIVEDYFFEKFAGMEISRSELPRNIYLKRGPAVDIGASADGRFLMVSHVEGAAVSLVETDHAEIIDELAPGGHRHYPLAMDVAVIQPDPAVVEKVRDAEQRTSIVVAEIEENVVVLADVDNKFQSFTNVSVAPLGLHWTDSEERRKPQSPLKVSASRNSETIIVANDSDSNVVVFSGRSNALERVNVVKLDRPPDDIGVSPNGELVAILNTVDASLRIIRNPVAWSSEVGTITGSEEIREAQLLLSMLLYPVGSVDGIDGPNTRRAVRLFQQSAGLNPTGIVDAATLEQLRNVASEVPQEVLSTQRGVTKRGVTISEFRETCTPVTEDVHCQERVRATRGAQRLFRNFPSRSTEEVICAAPEDSPLPVQIDAYDNTTKITSYVCTSFHSCSYVRFRNLPAYDAICGKK